MSKTFLHLFEDEKFIDVIVDQFETVAPDQSLYLIALASPEAEVKYIKTRHHNMVFTHIGSELMTNLFDHIDQFKVVILHNLFQEYKQKLVLRYKRTVYFHWMCWGGDLYNNTKQILLCKNNLNRESIVQKNVNGFIGDLISSVFPGLWDKYYLTPRGLNSSYKFKKLIQFIYSCSTVVPTEHSIIKKYLSRRIQYIPLKYGDLSALVGNGNNDICTHDFFLVGNSASLSSNHSQAFQYIKPYHSSGQKVIIPLSYGEISYAQIVIQEAQNLFGADAQPLEKFMDIDAYNQILQQCGHVVMNHYRQQAMGNILISLYKGARLFLNKRNPIYAYLQQLNVQVFNIETDLSRLSHLPSYSQLAAHNRIVLNKYYGRLPVLDETFRFVQRFV